MISYSYSRQAKVQDKLCMILSLITNYKRDSLVIHINKDSNYKIEYKEFHNINYINKLYLNVMQNIFKS